MDQALLWAALGTGFTWAMTAFGAASVAVFRKSKGDTPQRIFLGFAAGVMIAASVWSLLIPAIEDAEASGQIPWIPAAGGFVIGVVFLMVLHAILPHAHPEGQTEGPQTSLGRPMLLFSAMTLHNIPEGMSVGLLFAAAGIHGGDPAMFASAVALAIGIGIQNIPEGAAVSLPLMYEGMKPLKAFGMGALSGLAEPVFGILVVLGASAIVPYMPWLLSFSAGAMMYVVVEELIPDAHLGNHSNVGTVSVMAGFLLMMILDVALG